MFLNTLLLGSFLGSTAGVPETCFGDGSPTFGADEDDAAPPRTSDEERALEEDEEEEPEEEEEEAEALARAALRVRWASWRERMW